MKIILLSGGSGKRLWPLSNDARSKQFLRLLTGPDGEPESMIQRVVRQIRSARLTDDIVVATGVSQYDSIENQLGNTLSVVTEPCRRDTFPAIVLACSYLASKSSDMDEPVIVMPCDSYTEDSYFSVIAKMAEAVRQGIADLVLMGIEPTYPSAKYGYIVPDNGLHTDGAKPVKRFTEKPDVATAQKLICEEGMWNGGVFAFRLGYLMQIANRMMPETDFTLLRKYYHNLPKISFDYEVVEKAKSVAVIKYAGKWKDLGTWNTLTDELDRKHHGNVVAEECDSSYIINELEIPVVAIGAEDLVIAASPDGILVSERGKSENLKHLVDGLGKRPMYDERRWGEYKVVDYLELPNGTAALTKQLRFRAGGESSYHRHLHRTETWTFVSGEGEVVIEGKIQPIKAGDVLTIPLGCYHSIRAITPLSFIEVQQGTHLVEEDIERTECPI